MLVVRMKKGGGECTGWYNWVFLVDSSGDTVSP